MTESDGSGLAHRGALPFRMVGTHRRVRLVRLVGLLAYRDAQDASSRGAPEELTRQAETRTSW